jgi:hypothetical protein
VGRDTLLGIVWEAGTRRSFDASVLSGGCMVILGADLHVSGFEAQLFWLGSGSVRV